MDFLRSIGSGLSNIFHGIGHFFDGGDSSQAVTTTTTQVVQQRQQSNQNNGDSNGSSPQAQSRSPELNLFNGTLQKAQQPNQPSPEKTAADIGAMAGYGPNANPDPAALVKANPVQSPLQVGHEIGQEFGYGPQAIKAGPQITAAPAKPANPVIGTLQALNQAPALVKATSPAAYGDLVEQPSDTVTGNLLKAVNTAGMSQLGVNPAADVEGASNLVNGAINLVKGVPGALVKAGSAIKSAPEILGRAIDLVRTPEEVAASTEVAPGVHSTTPAPDNSVPSESALDTPTFQRQGQPAPVPQSPLDIPTYQRNEADQAVAAAQDKIDRIDAALNNVRPNNQATRAADQAELRAAQASSPQEGAQVLRQQMLRKAAGVTNPDEATAQLMAMREQASTELNNAKLAQQANGEVAPGVHSVNPTRAEDAAAAAQDAQQAQAATISATTPGTPPETGQPAVTPATTPTIEPAPVPGGSPTAPPETTSIPTSPAPGQGLAQPAGSGEVAQTLPTDVAQTQNGVNPPAPAPGGMRAPTPGENPLNPAAAPTEQTPGQQLLPSGQTAPNAPNVRAAAEKQLGDTAKTLGDPTEHDVFSNPELTAAGERYVAATSDEQLMDMYKNPQKLSTNEQLATARAAMPRLGKIQAEARASGNMDLYEKVTQAMDNAMVGAEEMVSKGGRTLNYAQDMFNSLSPEAKVNFIVNRMDKLRVAGGMASIKDDVETRAGIEKVLDGFFQKGQSLQDSLAKIETELEGYMSRQGNTPLNVKAVDQLSNDADNLRSQIAQNQGDLARFYDQNTPKAGRQSQRAGDFTRTLMLTNVAGRLSDNLTTGLNVAHTLTQMAGESLLGKATNLVKGPGAAISKMPSLGTLVKGSARGLQKVGSEFAGKSYLDGDVLKTLKAGDDGGRGQLSRGSRNNPFDWTRRVVHAGVEAATNLSRGVRDVQLERLADQEGRAAGLTGDDLKVYTKARMAMPTRQMLDNANQLHEEVNNMNDNVLSQFMGKMVGGVEKFPVFGPSIRNLVDPFTKWAAGQGYNAITDKNVLANFAKFTKAAFKGDTQGMIKNASGMALNSAGTMTLGWGLARSGMITTTDPEGYSDGGIYLHIGGRYIPAPTLGFWAPGIIMGASAYNAMHNPTKPGESMMGKIADAAGATATATARAYLANTIPGASNPLVQTAVSALRPNSTVTPLDVAETAGGQLASQTLVPGITGDVNAWLDNHQMFGPLGGPDLNPTHERAETSPKLTKANGKPGAKDYLQSAVDHVLAKIPGISQGLPRKAGVAAADEFDRVVRGTRDTPESTQKLADAKQAQDTAVADKAGDIPNPAAKNFADAIEAHIQNGKYDQAIAGLQQQRDLLAKDPNNTPKSKVTAVDNQIKELQVLKKGNYDPSIRDLYKQVTNTQWRDMGDPNSDGYDPKTYQLLWQYQNDLVNAGLKTNAAGINTDKFTPKAPPKGKSAGTKAANLIKSNTIGSIPTLAKIDFGKLAPQKATSVQALPLQQLQPSNLIKMRAISASRTK